MENNDIEQLLISIGLTKQESHCYLSLYKLKEAKTGELSKESGIATANIYPVLDSLLKKGLVSYRLQNNIKIFFASEPDAFNEFVELRQKQLDLQKEKVKQTISQLKRQKPIKETQSNYRYYEGISGIKAMFYDLMKDMENIEKHHILRIHGSTKKSTETMIGFYDEFHKVRLKHGFKYRLLLDNELIEHGKKRARMKNTEVKVIKINTEVNWGVLGDTTHMYYITGKTPVCFLIKDEKIARTYEGVFDKLWITAKKLKE